MWNTRCVFSVSFHLLLWLTTPLSCFQAKSYSSDHKLRRHWMDNSIFVVIVLLFWGSVLHYHFQRQNLNLVISMAAKWDHAYSHSLYFCQLDSLYWKSLYSRWIWQTDFTDSVIDKLKLSFWTVFSTLGRLCKRFWYVTPEVQLKLLVQAQRRVYVFESAHLEYLMPPPLAWCLWPSQATGNCKKCQAYRIP